MNPDNSVENLNANPDPSLQKINNPLSAMRQGERVLCEIKRHPIGIISVYVSAILVIGVVLSAVSLLPGHINNITSQDKAGLLLGALIIITIVLLYTYVARTIYKGNRWILTDDSLTQVTQTGLFRRHSSQLSLANLEDITADQNGFFQSMLGFGDLRAETAGERSKFVFPYCPHPNDYARRILQAREAFIMDNPEEAKRANDKLEVPRIGQTAGTASSQSVQIDPQQYEQFLQFQQMQAQQQAAGSEPVNQPSSAQRPEANPYTTPQQNQAYPPDATVDQNDQPTPKQQD